MTEEVKEKKNPFTELRRVTETTGKYAQHPPEGFKLLVGNKSEKENGPWKLTIRWPLGGVWILAISRFPFPGTKLYPAHTPPDKDMETIMYALELDETNKTVTLITLQESDSRIVMSYQE